MSVAERSFGLFEVACGDQAAGCVKRGRGLCGLGGSRRVGQNLRGSLPADAEDTGGEKQRQRELFRGARGGSCGQGWESDVWRPHRSTGSAGCVTCMVNLMERHPHAGGFA